MKTLAVLILFVAGCSKQEASPPPDLGAPYTRPGPVTVPPLAPLDLARLRLPRTDGGLPILTAGEGGVLALDPSLRTPITAMGRCLDLVTHCVRRPDRSFDACMLSAPACATETPWNEAGDCCPAACAAAYDAARAAGANEIAAVNRVFFEPPYCVPGMAAYLQNGRGGK